MTDAPPLQEFYGYLGQFEVGMGRVTLRFYPFSFHIEEIEPVLEVVIEHPEFAEDAIRPFLHEEVEVAVYPVSTVIEDVWTASSIELRGARVLAAFKPYNLGDYVGHIGAMDKVIERQAKELQQANYQLAKIKAVCTELMRRAEIKADASEAHRARQTEAIKILHRVLAELELSA